MYNYINKIRFGDVRSPVPIRFEQDVTRCEGDNLAVIFFSNNFTPNVAEFGIVIGIEKDLEIRWRKEKCIELLKGKYDDISFETHSVISHLINSDIITRIKYLNYKPEFSLKFPSITQFKEATRKLNQYGNNQPVELTGFAKVHGVNGSLIFTGEEIIKQSKESTITILDKCGLAHHIENDELGFRCWGERTRAENGLSYPFIVAFEYAGGNIQPKSSVKGVDQFLAVFLVGNLKRNVETNELEADWEIPKLNVTEDTLNIFDIREFGTHTVVYDPAKQGDTQRDLAELTIAAEEECPVAKYFGIKSDVGEGLVWHPTDNGSSIGLYFKVKGQRHSNIKIRKLASPNPETLNGINDFIDYVCTDNRLEQGVKETGDISKENMGNFLGWMARDVMKEESDTLLKNDLNWNKVAKQFTAKCMQWYKSQI